MATTNYIYIRLDPEFKKKIDVLASIKGTTVSNVARICLTQWVRENENYMNRYLTENGQKPQ